MACFLFSSPQARPAALSQDTALLFLWEILRLRMLSLVWLQLTDRKHGYLHYISYQATITGSFLFIYVPVMLLHKWHSPNIISCDVAPDQTMFFVGLHEWAICWLEVWQLINTTHVTPLWGSGLCAELSLSSSSTACGFLKRQHSSTYLYSH